MGPAGEREPAGAAHARPLRPPHRRGRVPPGLARAARRSPCQHGLHSPALARAAARRARRARRAVHDCTAQVEGGHGCPISMTYSAVPGAARAARAGRGVGAAPRRRTATTRALRAGRGEGRRAVRHGDDREAGRLRRARQHDVARAAERRRPGGRVRDHRPQVVLLGADVRRVPGAGAGRAAACPASCCRACCPTARATASTSSA